MNRTPSEVFNNRTPGQLLSLTSHLSFVNMSLFGIHSLFYREKNPDVKSLFQGSERKAYDQQAKRIKTELSYDEIPENEDEQNVSGVLPFYSAETSVNNMSESLSYHSCETCSKNKNLFCTCSCQKNSCHTVSMLTPSPLLNQTLVLHFQFFFFFKSLINIQSEILFVGRHSKSQM